MITKHHTVHRRAKGKLSDGEEEIRYLELMKENARWGFAFRITIINKQGGGPTALAVQAHTT